MQVPQYLDLFWGKNWIFHPSQVFGQISYWPRKLVIKLTFPSSFVRNSWHVSSIVLFLHKIFTSVLISAGSLYFWTLERFVSTNNLLIRISMDFYVSLNIFPSSVTSYTLFFLCFSYKHHSFEFGRRPFVKRLCSQWRLYTILNNYNSNSTRLWSSTIHRIWMELETPIWIPMYEFEKSNTYTFHHSFFSIWSRSFCAS